MKKLIIVFFALFMLFASLYPPYQWKSIRGNGFIVSKSYEFIFSNEITANKLWARDSYISYVPAERQIIFSELLIEYIMIIIFWGSIYILFNKQRKESIS